MRKKVMWMFRPAAAALAGLLWCITFGATPVRADVSYERLKSFGLPGLAGQNPMDPILEGQDGALYGTCRSPNNGSLGVLYKVLKNGTGYQVLHTFYSDQGDGAVPYGALLEASDGALYGTTSQGGTNGYGTIYKINKDGTNYAVLHNFDFSGGNGQNPEAGLIEGSDGALYGTTFYGGLAGAGTVFKINKDGSHFAIVRSFSFNDGYGVQNIIFASDGLLYGITQHGGSGSGGVVFSLNRDGGGYRKVFELGIGELDAITPTGLMEASDGALYCTSLSRSTAGTVFTISKYGSGVNFLHAFEKTGTDGQSPLGGVIEGNDGALYGTTSTGGSNNFGTVFALNKNGGGYAILHHFSGSADGQGADGGLCQASDGALYGTTANGGSNSVGTVFKLGVDGQGFTLLRTFSSSALEGQMPNQLVKASDGLLYGTTSGGGVYGNNGTVFKVKPDGGSFTVLRSFGATAADGQYPQGGFFEGNDGTLYGITSSGGSNLAGTLFKLGKDGSNFTTLHSFSYLNRDGEYPNALIQGSDLLLYGTTYFGGTNGGGTVFKLNKDGTGYRTVRSFNNIGTDSQSPYALMEGSDGTLYGTAVYGGTGGAGTLFKLNKDGSNYRVLHNFSTNNGDGQYALALLEGTDGSLYGSTIYGGAGVTNQYQGNGTIFKINKDGSGYGIVRDFNTDFYQGAYPEGLIEGVDGALYGTTFSGGNNGSGTLFMVSKDGCAFGLEYSFGAALGDGSDPSSLISTSDGVFYGTTGGGGDLGFGTVFRLQVIPPTVLAITAQPQGQTVRAGTNVTFCVVASSSLPITFQWRFNGTNIGDATNSSLSITNVQFVQGGAYDVVVSDTNSIVSDLAILIVLSRPVITAQPFPTNQTVVAGTTATISVSAIGTLPLTFGWRLNSTRITNITLNSFTCVLTLDNVETNQAGSYRVGIINALGSAASLSLAATLNVLPDTDRDGLPDDWETLYGLNPNDPTDAAQDLDGDKMTNLQEYIAGTDPRDPQSYLKLTVTNMPSGAALQFQAVSNRTYTIEFNSRLDGVGWSNVVDVAAAPTNRMVIVSDPAPSSRNPQRFYRLLTPQARLKQ